LIYQPELVYGFSGPGCVELSRRIYVFDGYNARMEVQTAIRDIQFAVRWLTSAIAAATCFALAAQISSAADPAAGMSPSTPQASTVRIKLSSTGFDNDGPIPRIYTGESDDHSPPLAWEGAPDDTKEFALICDDPDAPSTDPWVHWVIYGIAADVHALPEGLSKTPQLANPIVAKQGKNSWTSGATLGYRGPMPPPGKPHHYHFNLYALDTKVDLAPSATKDELLKSIQGHILAEGELVGTYSR
jgi:Raf kinase inhibitor-like YbhB/YbcL family protein